MEAMKHRKQVQFVNGTGIVSERRFNIPWLDDLHPNYFGLASAFLYGTCSVSIAFVNKGLMTTMEFDYPVFIMVAQMLFTLALLEILGMLKIVELPAYTLKRGKMFAFPALFYGINSVLALSALSHMNVAVYGVLKRCVPLATMILSMFILKKDFPSRKTIVAIVLITSGCVLAGYGDLKFNLMAYMCGILSNFTQSLYLLMVQKVTDGHLSTVETLQLNSINTLPLLFIITMLNGELVTLYEYKYFFNLGFIVLFILAISLGCLLNYSLFLCTSLTSALTTSVVGGFKALAQTLLGLFTFGGVSHNISTFSGIGLNLSGAILYIWVKYQENLKKRSVDLRKVMSFSTAEDLRTMEEESIREHGTGENGGVVSNDRNLVESDKGNDMDVEANINVDRKHSS